MSSRREAKIVIEEAENSSVPILVHGHDLVIAGSEEAIRRHAGTILRLRDDIIDVLNGEPGRLSFDDWCNLTRRDPPKSHDR